MYKITSEYKRDLKYSFLRVDTDQRDKNTCKRKSNKDG